MLLHCQQEKVIEHMLHYQWERVIEHTRQRVVEIN